MKNPIVFSISGLLLGVFLWLLPQAAIAQATPIMPYQEYGKRLKAAGLVGPLKSDLFGDNVSLYNGSTEFMVVDIDLPGNNALPVRLARRFKVESSREFADTRARWFFDAPYLTTYNWNQGSSTTPNRCTDRWLPYVLTGFNLEDFWHGVQLHMPGQGDEDLRWVVNTLNGSLPYAMPSTGGPYNWGTRSNFRFSCLPNTSNGFNGQAFLGVDPQGNRYFFDIGYEASLEPIYKRVFLEFDVLTPMHRAKSYLLLRRVEDRLGNWVNYAWSANQLQSITASDGRSIVLTRNGAVATATVSNASGTRTWSYEGINSTYGLSRVVLPDNSTWEYSYSGTTSPIYPIDDAGNAGDFRCLEPLDFGHPFTMTMKHPSGASGTFWFYFLRHRRAGLSPNVCALVSSYQGRNLYEMQIPEFFDVYSILAKQITGPGVPTQTWTYGYEIIPNGRTGSVIPGGSCDGSKYVTVGQPDGTSIDYRFGVILGCNDGRLLETLTRDAAGHVVKSVTNQYMTRTQAAQMPFPEFAGGISQVGDDPIGNLELPLVSTVTRTGTDIATSPSDAFVTHYEAFDQFARPTRIARSGIGNGGASAVPPVIAPVLTLTPTAGYANASYTLSWTVVYGATRYELSQSGTVIQNSAATSKTWNTGAVGTYNYRVRACNDTGCSTWSAEKTRTTLDNNPPPPPPPPDCNWQMGTCEQPLSTTPEETQD